MLVCVWVGADGSIKYKDARVHSWEQRDLAPVKDAQEMRQIIDAQNQLTFLEFYVKYLEKKNQKPSRKRKAPKRWGFDEH